jgi:type II secretory pathway predicted ATPase ExeA
MFEPHFGLRENPFSTGHDPRFVYPSPEHLEAVAHFRYGIQNREAFVLVTGEVGTGKTTAIYDLISRLPQQTHLALINNSSLTRLELLEEIARRFGLETPQPPSKPALLSAIEMRLSAHVGHGEACILIVDEAQNLSHDLLEEIRLLSNLEDRGGHLLHICLVGQPELEEKLARPELRQLRQRISVKYRLKPLTPDECQRYINHRLRVAGGEPEAIFTNDSIAAVHRMTHGIPREINIVASQAMVNAYVEGARPVRPEHVRAVFDEFHFQSVLEPRDVPLATEPHPQPPPAPPLPRVGAPAAPVMQPTPHHTLPPTPPPSHAQPPSPYGPPQYAQPAYPQQIAPMGTPPPVSMRPPVAPAPAVGASAPPPPPASAPPQPAYAPPQPQPAYAPPPQAPVYRQPEPRPTTPPPVEVPNPPTPPVPPPPGPPPPQPGISPPAPPEVPSQTPPPAPVDPPRTVGNWRERRPAPVSIRRGAAAGAFDEELVEGNGSPDPEELRARRSRMIALAAIVAGVLIGGAVIYSTGIFDRKGGAATHATAAQPEPAPESGANATAPVDTVATTAPAPVRQETRAQAPARRPAVSASSSTAGSGALAFGLQVASFRTAGTAARVLRDLETTTGLPGEVLTNEIEDETWYRIVVGRFADESRARETADDLLARSLIAEAIVIPYRPQTR